MQDRLQDMIKDIGEVQGQLGTIPDAVRRAQMAHALNGYKQALTKHEQAWSKNVVTDDKKERLQGHINQAYAPVEDHSQGLAEGYRQDKGKGWEDFKTVAPQLRKIMNEHVKYADSLDIEIVQAMATIQEQIYGIKIDFDPNGRPILEAIPTKSQMVEGYGLDHNIGQTQEKTQDLDQPSLDLNPSGH